MPHNDLKLITALGGAGLLVGIGQMLTSEEKLTPRLIIGRAILSGVCGLAAGVLVLFMPDAPFVAQVAFACIMASLGTSAMEAVFHKWMGKK